MCSRGGRRLIATAFDVKHMGIGKPLSPFSCVENLPALADHFPCDPLFQHILPDVFCRCSPRAPRRVQSGIASGD